MKARIEEVKRKMAALADPEEGDTRAVVQWLNYAEELERLAGTQEEALMPKAVHAGSRDSSQSEEHHHVMQ